MTGLAPTPAATGEPSAPVGRGWMLALGLANLGAFAAFFGPLQVLLAQQAEELAPRDKEAALALVTGVGALVSLVANPLWGALSDRTSSRFGRRRPWVVGGAIAGAAALLALAGVRDVALMVVAWGLVQASVNAAFAAVMAAIPDRVPRVQRGVVGGTVALAQTLGAMVGTGLAMVTGSWSLGYAACAAFLVLSCLPYGMGRGTDSAGPGPAGPFRAGTFLREFWVDPRLHPDFGWAWFTRFLVHTGNALGLVYLYYFLDDGVGHDDPEGGVFLLTLLYSLASVATALLAGKASDRLGRRKAFVSTSGIVMAVATALLALAPVWPVVVGAAVVLGAGFGVFVAVDYALMTEVLPRAADVGRDLGIINIASALPQVLAPVVAAPVVTVLGGYPVLYLLAAGSVLLGALLVRRIRGVA